MRQSRRVVSSRRQVISFGEKKGETGDEPEERLRNLQGLKPVEEGAWMSELKP